MGNWTAQTRLFSRLLALNFFPFPSFSLSLSFSPRAFPISPFTQRGKKGERGNSQHEEKEEEEGVVEREHLKKEDGW